MVADDGLLVLGVDHLAAPNTKSSPSMVLMKPAADELLLELVERSLSVELHASRSPPAPPTWPWQSKLRAVVSLFRGRFPTHRGTSRQTVRLGPEQYGHRGHESVSAPAIFCLFEVEKVIQ